MSANYLHLDAAESIFFTRELEHVKRQAYEVRYPGLRSRYLIPTESDVPSWARVLTWRMSEDIGDDADFLTDQTTDASRVDVRMSEASKLIKTIGKSFGYSIDELKESAATGKPLDQSRALAARRRVEVTIDKLLALGDAANNIEGLLALTGAGTYTPLTKTAGGTTWGTLAAPNATGMEVATDLMAIAKEAHEASKGIYDRFTIALPLDLYGYASQKILFEGAGNASNITALQFALSTSPFIAEVVPWLRCSGVGSVGTGGGNTRMVCYPKDPEVVAAIVPQEWETMQPQLKGFSYSVLGTAKCGGVVSRVPSMVRYGDGI